MMSFSAVYDFLMPMWVEVSFTTFFILGFVVLRLDKFQRRTNKKGKKVNEPLHRLHKTVEAEVSSGCPVAALKAWRAMKNDVATSIETLKLITQAFLDEEPESFVEEISEHIGAHSDEIANTKSANAILDIVARSGNVKLLGELANAMRYRFRVQPTIQTYEILMGGHATVGDKKKVENLIEELGRQKVSARAHSLIIKGYLKNSMTDDAFHQLQQMQASGFFIPSFAVAQLFRTAIQSGRAEEFFNKNLEADTKIRLQLPAEAVAVLLEDCSKRDDIDLAIRVEEVASEAKTQLTVNAYDSLLKLCVAHADIRALEIFQHMERDCLRISEGLCVGLLARCAESKFLRFAEMITTYVRGKDGMSIAVYSALMKVYAYCGMFDKACDLYPQLREDGLVPDSMMYGCLMKFAVECGRTELSQELFNKAPSLDIQNYMSLIRAAGRDRDVDRAFTILKRLKESGVSADIAAYNCTLDACINANEVQRGRELVNEMQRLGKSDIITYNTLLKGYCNSGDIQGAKDLCLEMEKNGHPPNDVSYNCMINAAVSKGLFREAWTTIETMQSKGIAVDHYTISIMMKALKRAKDPRDVARALALLDNAGLDVCSDEVLLNTVLETCIRHREFRRLSDIVDAVSKSQVQPSAHTYGSLIKACSTLKRLDGCWTFWNSMAEQRALQPNDIVLGCMLDALVTNGHIDDAVSLFGKWKNKVEPNTVMYSTLIKGFANTRQAARALDLWREMKALKLTMNTVAYNALIDSQARVGAIEGVSTLVASMEEDGCRPDAITYSTIVKGYCMKGDLDKALEVFRTMQNNNMAVDCIIYNTVLDGCTRHNRMDLADIVLADMDKYNIKASNFTLGILVKMYGRRKQLDKALEVLQVLPKKHGITPNAQVSTCLIGACLNCHDVDKAVEVFESLKASGEKADSKAYGALISGLVRHGQVEKAVSVVMEACADCKYLKHGEKLIETDSLEQLLRALTQKGLMETLGVTMVERLRSVGMPISGSSLAVFTTQKRSQRY